MNLSLPTNIDHILVIDDDPLMQIVVSALFTKAGHVQVSCEGTVRSGIEWFDDKPATDNIVLILDLGLPDGDGKDVLDYLSTHRPQTPVIVITSESTIETKLAVLTQGADAYLQKPFIHEELLVTLRSVCRRVFAAEERGSLAHWQLIVRQWILIAPNDVEIRLSVPETQLLDLLQRHYGKPVSRLKISESLGSLYRYSGNSLEAMISRLRKKINQAYPDVEVVRAVNGTGYILVLDIR
ncbi:response regulator transcription factor [Methylophilus luteus]|uniref:Response regulator transcription factor n=1 Tax=Methylophilus luteus TaxID=640108 RepID=A0ABW3FBE0_9PROT